MTLYIAYHNPPIHAVCLKNFKNFDSPIYFSLTTETYFQKN